MSEAATRSRVIFPSDHRPKPPGKSTQAFRGDPLTHHGSGHSADGVPQAPDWLTPPPISLPLTRVLSDRPYNPSPVLTWLS